MDYPYGHGANNGESSRQQHAFGHMGNVSNTSSSSVEQDVYYDSIPDESSWTEQDSHFRDQAYPTDFFCAPHSYSQLQRNPEDLRGIGEGTGLNQAPTSAFIGGDVLGASTRTITGPEPSTRGATRLPTNSERLDPQFFSWCVPQVCAYSYTLAEWQIMKSGVEQCLALVMHAINSSEQDATQSHVPPSVPSQGRRGQRKYRFCCKLGDSECLLIFRKGSTFDRHVTTQHDIRYEYHCPEDACIWQTPRRDKFRNHLGVAHKSYALSKEYLESLKIELTAPAVCSICKKDVSSWRTFLACVRGHCRIPTNEGSKGGGSPPDGGNSEGTGGNEGGSDSGPGGQGGFSSADGAHQPYFYLSGESRYNSSQAGGYYGANYLAMNYTTGSSLSRGSPFDSSTADVPGEQLKDVDTHRASAPSAISAEAGKGGSHRSAKSPTPTTMTTTAEASPQAKNSFASTTESRERTPHETRCAAPAAFPRRVQPLGSGGSCITATEASDRVQIVPKTRRGRKCSACDDICDGCRKLDAVVLASGRCHTCRDACAHRRTHGICASQTRPMRTAPATDGEGLEARLVTLARRPKKTGLALDHESLGPSIGDRSKDTGESTPRKTKRSFESQGAKWVCDYDQSPTFTTPTHSTMGVGKTVIDRRCHSRGKSSGQQGKALRRGACLEHGNSICVRLLPNKPTMSTVEKPLRTRHLNCLLRGRGTVSLVLQQRDTHESLARTISCIVDMETDSRNPTTF